MPSARAVVAVDHPAFAGHFPGRPLLPGVSLLSEVMEAVLADARAQGSASPGEASGLKVSVVKFLHPVLPGDALRIDWTRQEARIRFEVWTVRSGASDDTAVMAASGQLEWPQ